MATQVTKPIISVIGGTQAGIRVLTQLLKQNNLLNKVTLQLYEQEPEVYYPDLLPYMSTNHISSLKCSKHIGSILPKEVNIIKESPSEIDTKNQSLSFESGEKHHYDYLVLALDKQEDYQGVKGIKEALKNPQIPVVNASNYRNAQKYHDHLRAFRGGKLQFYVPAAGKGDLLHTISTINLSLEYLKKKSLNFQSLFKTDIVAQNESPQKIIDHYESQKAQAELQKHFRIYEHEGLTLREVNLKKQTAIYEDSSSKTKSLPFDLLYADPQRNLPAFLKNFPNTQGEYLEVDSSFLNVKGLNNVFSLGHLANLGARNYENLTLQADVVASNIVNQALNEGKLVRREYSEQNVERLYLGNQKIRDSHVRTLNEDWQTVLNYYNRIFVEPFKYKSLF